jgi:hypothetical protein
MHWNEAIVRDVMKLVSGLLQGVLRFERLGAGEMKLGLEIA